MSEPNGNKSNQEGTTRIRAQPAVSEHQTTDHARTNSTPVQRNPLFASGTQVTKKPNVAVISIPLQDQPKKNKYPRPPTPPPILKTRKGKQAQAGLPEESLQEEFEVSGRTLNMINGGLSLGETDVDVLDNGVAGKRKNVSWNEKVQFQAETASDLGVNDSDGTGGANIQLVRQIVGEEKLQEPNGYLPECTQAEIAPQHVREDGDFRKEKTAQGKIKKKKNSTFRKYMLVAIILLIVAIGGLVALGTLYAIKYLEPDDDNSADITGLKARMSLVEPVTSISPWSRAWHTDPYVGQVRGLVEYLAEFGDIMIWFQPAAAAANMMWHRGSPLKVYSLTPTGSLETAIVGDPLEISEASFVLHLDNSTWYAGELLHGDEYSVVSIGRTSGTNLSFTIGDVEELVRRYSAYESVVRSFAANSDN